MPGYRKYLQSEHWKAFRLKALERAGYACQLCNRKQKDGATLHVHHRSYTRIGHEDEMDVVVLCSECHKKFHGINESNKTICMPVKKGNYTGGKASYVMVMQKAVELFMRDEKAKGDKLLQLGILNALCGCVEFKTGKLVNRKTKQAMQRKDIMKVTGIGKSKLDRILQDMKSNGIITRTNDGYFVSRDFIKKGAK